jgi:hypothetical protein
MFEGTGLVLNTESVPSNIGYKFFMQNFKLIYLYAKFLLWSQKLWYCKPTFRIPLALHGQQNGIFYFISRDNDQPIKLKPLFWEATAWDVIIYHMHSVTNF